jgi:hypothetical protein
MLSKTLLEAIIKVSLRGAHCKGYVLRSRIPLQNPERVAENFARGHTEEEIFCRAARFGFKFLTFFSIF